MRTRNRWAMLSLLAGATAFAAGCISNDAPTGDGPAGALRPAGLRCENLTNPAGLTERIPRLSWRVESDARGQVQSAYRILVASSPERLRRGEGDLWDTGRIESDATRDHAYGGTPLVSRQACWWSVKVWDRHERPSEWSEPAEWSMGLLDAKDWSAEWIGLDAARPAWTDEDFAEARWLGFPGDPDPAPTQPRWFVRVFELPATQVVSARLRFASDDRGTAFLNGDRVLNIPLSPESWKRAMQADIAAGLRPGPNRIAIRNENLEPGPRGIIVRLTIALADGQIMELVSDGSWKASAKNIPKWETESVEDGWPFAKDLGPAGCAPWGAIRSGAPLLPPPIHLRREFAVSKPVRRAVIYTTSLGIHDLSLNGEAVADDWFNPGWTDYALRVHARAYDVTARLKPGPNALGATLAEGWFSGYVGYGGQRDHYGAHPRLKAQMHIDYADGTTEILATGPGWKASTGGLKEADFLMGEMFDAAAHPYGWDRPGFDDAAWLDISTGAEIHPAIEAHPGPPVRVVGEFRPVAWTSPAPGVWIADLGQNIAGVVRLTVRGRPGQRIVLRHGERLADDGSLYTINLRTARATDVYVCRGGGIETWTPRFTFHGFQFVELTGLDGKPGPETVVGLALSSDTPPAGGFECSSPMLNRLWKNAVWTQYANFIDVPTDCPQRDERLGWTGDAQAYIGAACKTSDTQAFFTKWLIDLADAQRADGQFPAVAPLRVARDDGGPAWSDAGVICPWAIYDIYGDRRLLQRMYPHMARFIDFRVNRSTPDLLPPETFHCYGDWLSINADTPKDLIYTAYFAMSARLMARAAGVLGKADDAAKYMALYERVKTAFNAAYVAEDGLIKGDTQTAYILALAADLVDGRMRDEAARRLVANIEARENHLSTGFVGTRDIMHVLSKIGRTDVAYRLLHNETFPSWGFTIKHGATTIWERWDGWTPDKGFQTPGMNSFAHYAFGAVIEWMVENIGGIRRDSPAYRTIRIAPSIDPNLEWARVRYDSPQGPILSAWRKTAGGGLAFDLEIPANTTAIVALPAATAAAVTEGGRSLAAAGFRIVSEADSTVELAVGSGRYAFQVAGR